MSEDAREVEQGLTFFGPLRFTMLRDSEGRREFCIVPLSQAEAVELLCRKQVREAFYAGVAAAMCALDEATTLGEGLTAGQMRALLGAVRHPADRARE